MGPASVSDGIWKKYHDLPFLLKILSIRKALSIQAHPDKVLGARLHAEFPTIYKDPNHKPEMAVALTTFEAFIGFRPLEEIATNIEGYPEFASIVGEAGVEFLALARSGSQDRTANKKALKKVFSALQHTPQDSIATAVRALIARIRHSSGGLDHLLLRLHSEFPDDVGTFCALMLNYVSLAPGSAIFLA
ncbi:Mannose-6-phosphate isomerase, partial [Kappamyces sp. JEL0680]